MTDALDAFYHCEEKKMNLSFAGCGFLGIYHVGVACCFRKYTPHLLLNKISGASAGAMAACCLICDLPLGEFTSDILRMSTEARRRSLGPFTPSFNIHRLLLEGLERVLPDDAHLRVSGKLHISLTRVHDGKNVMVSQFDTRDELIQALLASAFIPFFSGLIPPKFRGVRYMDGGYSDNLPTLDENTITVSPFCGESDICPRDDSAQLFHINIANTSIELSSHNIYRMLRILFPPKPEVLSNMCKQGFDDALRFLHRNNLISCTRCLAVQSTFVVSNTLLMDGTEYDPQCHECKLHRQEALVSNMPEHVLNVFQEVIDSANKGLLNWLFKYRGMKLLSVLSIPYTLPADILYVTFTKLLAATPSVGNCIWDVSRFCLEQFIQFLQRLNSKSKRLSANISCHLALTEYGKDDIELCSEADGTVLLLPSENEMDLKFTVNLDQDASEASVDCEQSTKTATKTSPLQRQPSLTIINSSHTGDDEQFERILQVTAHHESLMAYYYLDDNNKLKVTEIYDVTDSDSPAVQGVTERDTNSKLEFDDVEVWGEEEDEVTTWSSSASQTEGVEYCEKRRRGSLAEVSETGSSHSSSEVEAIQKGVSTGKSDASSATNVIFSDPESDWLEEKTSGGGGGGGDGAVTTVNKPATAHASTQCCASEDDDVVNKPESEQSETAGNNGARK